jgi:hypothetical protein
MLFNSRRVHRILPVRPIVGATAAVLFTLAFGLEPQPAQACGAYMPLYPEDARRADVVFTGRLLKYERVTPDPSFNLSRYGLLTIRVETVLQGQIAGDIQLYWWNSTFGVPAEWKKGENLLVAAARANRPDLSFRGTSATVFFSRRPNLLQILQASCSSPFIFPSSPDNIETMQAVLAGKSGDDARFTGGYGLY